MDDTLDVDLDVKVKVKLESCKVQSVLFAADKACKIGSACGNKKKARMNTCTLDAHLYTHFGREDAESYYFYG